MVSLIVLALVFGLIAVRRVGRLRLQIWHVMVLGALVVLIVGEIRPLEALRAINVDVLLFLFGMFIVGHAMEESGYLSSLSYRIFGRFRTTGGLLAAILGVMGCFSALLMNDTIAIVGTPVVLSLARCAGIRPQPLLLALACAVTVGSVVSPIGNPQNLLVAIHGNVANPFVTFGAYLLAPTLICGVVVYGVLRLLYRRELGSCEVVHVYAPLTDPALARLCRVSLAVLAAMLVAKVSLVFLNLGVEFSLKYIALATALPVLVGSSRRVEMVTHVDWTTLVFFAAMFVLMESVWLSGTIQRALGGTQLDLAAPGVIIALSVGASQLLSNVPLTALYLPMLQDVGASSTSYMALAAGSTIAGMLTILGAASNVIIIQTAEKRSGVTLGVAEFVRAGIPLTLACAAIYWLFLS
ncbi:MAG: anion transporter [Dehalococcoidia bacterium]|jgi:Na+/H+ antiporter NhaD/arsenite permease-like protein|nr:anion transporter [Dehalococcoidia bacterium]